LVDGKRENVYGEVSRGGEQPVVDECRHGNGGGERMEKHVTLVAAFHIGYGVLGIVSAIVIWAVVVGMAFIPEETEVIRIVSAITNVVAVVILFVSIPGIVGGVGLLKRQSWARILVLIVSVLHLFRVPIGTALGIYSIWALTNEETKQLLASR
jgi:hypothetical protein